MSNTIAKVTTIERTPQGFILPEDHDLILISIKGKRPGVEAASPIIEREFIPFGAITKEAEAGQIERQWIADPPEPEVEHPSFEEWLERFQVPMELRRDLWWRPILYIFTQVPALRQHITPKNFDFKKRLIDDKRLRRIDEGSGINFLIDLALHLYNDNHKLPSTGLTGMGNLDPKNYQIALDAIKMRFN